MALDREALGRRIAAARELAGFRTQVALAEALRDIGIDITKQSLSAYERGMTKPPYDVMAGIVELCKVPWDFFGQEGLETGTFRVGDRERAERAVHEKVVSQLLAEIERVDKSKVSIALLEEVLGRANKRPASSTGRAPDF